MGDPVTASLIIAATTATVAEQQRKSASKQADSIRKRQSVLTEPAPIPEQEPTAAPVPEQIESSSIIAGETERRRPRRGRASTILVDGLGERRSVLG